VLRAACMHTSCLELDDENQQDKYQHADSHNRAVIFDAPCYMVQLLARAAKPTLCHVDVGIELGEETVVHVELLVDLQRDMVLSVDGMG